MIFENKLKFATMTLPVQLKTKVVFIIPKTDNNGAKFKTEAFRWLFHTLSKLAGGFNMQPTFGGWERSNGEVQYEESLKFTVGINESEVQKLFQLLVMAKDVFQQEALYVEYQGQIVIVEEGGENA